MNARLSCFNLTNQFKALGIYQSSDNSAGKIEDLTEAVFVAAAIGSELDEAVCVPFAENRMRIPYLKVGRTSAVGRERNAPTSQRSILPLVTQLLGRYPVVAAMRALSTAGLVGVR